MQRRWSLCGSTPTSWADSPTAPSPTRTATSTRASGTARPETPTSPASIPLTKITPPLPRSSTPAGLTPERAASTGRALTSPTSLPSSAPTTAREATIPTAPRCWFSTATPARSSTPTRVSAATCAPTFPMTPNPTGCSLPPRAAFWATPRSTGTPAKFWTTRKPLFLTPTATPMPCPPVRPPCITEESTSAFPAPASSAPTAATPLQSMT